MKKIITIVLTVMIAHISYAQQSVFAGFENNDEVTSVVVNKKAFLMLKKATAESQEAEEFRNLVSGLNELRVLTTEHAATAKEMKAAFDSYLKKNKLSELMRVKDKDANVKIYVKEGKDDYVTEFLMLVDEMDISAK